MPRPVFEARKGRTPGGAPCNAIVSPPTAFTQPEPQAVAGPPDRIEDAPLDPREDALLRTTPPTDTPGKTAFGAGASVEIIRKRRKGYPSESRVKRGRRFVHGGKELVEKLGRNDPCPCGSPRRFKALLPAWRTF